MRLPPDALERNTDEFLWNILKYQRLANFCPGTIGAMKSVVRRELRRMKDSPSRSAAGSSHAKTLQLLGAVTGGA